MDSDTNFRPHVYSEYLCCQLVDSTTVLTSIASSMYKYSLTKIQYGQKQLAMTMFPESSSLIVWLAEPDNWPRNPISHNPTSFQTNLRLWALNNWRLNALSESRIKWTVLPLSQSCTSMAIGNPSPLHCSCQLDAFAVWPTKLQMMRKHRMQFIWSVPCESIEYQLTIG